MALIWTNGLESNFSFDVIDVVVVPLLLLPPVGVGVGDVDVDELDSESESIRSVPLLLFGRATTKSSSSPMDKILIPDSDCKR
jgi:hypothetical protein